MTRVRPARARLLERMGAAIVDFQEASHAFDDVAAEILALARADLPCLTLLLFRGPARVDEIATALQASPTHVTRTLERLALAGYARRQPGVRSAVELTDHARQWIERIWGPLQQDGVRLLQSFSTPNLALLADFVARACGIQESRERELRAWLQVPDSPARRPHLRGGLSPAALRRVQLFVEANLHRPIRLADLAARAGLSPFHFARSFRISTAVTPRAFVESRRIERARQLIERSDVSLADIAVQCGLQTQSRMTTTFKRVTGFTPARHRRNSLTS